MKKLLIYLKDYKKETVCAPLFKMLEAMFELFVPFVMADIIDSGIRQSNAGFVLRSGLLLVVLGLVGLVLLHYGTVFCGQSGGGIFHEAEARPF